MNEFFIKMPNEFNRLLNTLNNYITCCACKKTNEIEILLRCSHAICSDCKIKRKKCPTCYTNLSSARKKLPSVKFIEEIRNELLKRSPGLLVDECIVPKTNTKNSCDKKEKFADFKMVRNPLAKRKSSIIREQDESDDNDVVMIEDKINKTNIGKNKKKKVFYGSYSELENSEVCGQILTNLGIVGIDKHPQMDTNEVEWNGQLNSIISRLNRDSSAMSVDSDQGGGPSKKSSPKDSDGLKKRTSTDSSVLSSKRIRSENERTKEKSSVNSVISPGFANFGKVLGVIVDETEIVQRYLNANKTEDRSERLCDKQRNGPICDFLTDSKESPITDNEEKNSGYKLDVSKQDDLLKCRESLDDVELQSDIMADMLNNVSNEIVIVGNTLRSFAFTNKDDSSFSFDFPEVSDIENKVVEPLSRPAIDKLSPTKKDCLNKITDKNTISSDYIVISDSDDDIEKDSNTNLNDNNKVCRSLSPSTFRKISKSSEYFNHNDPKDENVPIENIMDIKIDDSNITSKQSASRETYKKASKKLDDESIDFDGFTDQDILISTIKLALFKMNGSKYPDISSISTNMYTLNGKILIQTVSESERNTGSPDQEINSSDVAIEISDSEDESPKVLISSSAQTDNEILAVTPSPSTSRIRPVSITKLRELEKANEKFMKNDILDTSEPLTPFTPNQEDIAKPHSHKTTVTPVSRRQLSFMSPLVEKASKQSLKNGETEDDSNEIDKGSNSSSSDDWRMLHYRMLYSMPNCPDDSLIATRLTLTTCSLNTKETVLVTKLARMTNSGLSKDFTHNTTHLIIGATGRGTLEYYLAIAYRAFIVTMEWVTLCIALNKILPVTGFIPTEDEGPLKCLEPISPPFVGFYICSKIFSANNYPIAEITKTLLSLGGAKMLPDIDAFQTLQDSSFPRFFVYDGKTQITQPLIDKCASMHIVPVQFMWVYDSISAFRALPVMDYLGEIIHSRTLIRDYKIPEQLACSRYPRLEGEFRPQILDERYQRSI